jgi:hypothetical protein
MWTPQCTAPARLWIQAIKVIIFIWGGTSFTMLDMSRRKQKTEELMHLNRANNWQRYIPEIPSQISSEVRGYNI